MEFPNHVGDPLRPLLYAAGALAVVIAIGTFGYVIIEGWSVFDGLYMTVTTITTVGYREVNPLSAACQPNLEMSAFSQHRNVRFMFRSPPSVRLVLAAIVCATDGLGSA